MLQVRLLSLAVLPAPFRAGTEAHLELNYWVEQFAAQFVCRINFEGRQL